MGGRVGSMKVTVITDAQGHVLGTMRRSEERDKQGPATAFVVAAGQKTTEVDLPEDLLKGSADDLHKAVARHIKK
jgi:hypothetical protein